MCLLSHWTVNFLRAVLLIFFFYSLGFFFFAITLQRLLDTVTFVEVLILTITNFNFWIADIFIWFKNVLKWKDVYKNSSFPVIFIQYAFSRSFILFFFNQNNEELVVWNLTCENHEVFCHITWIFASCIFILSS